MARTRRGQSLVKPTAEQWLVQGTISVQAAQRPVGDVGEKTEIQATGSAIGSGGNGPAMWILLGLAILLVVVVALVLVRSRRSRVPPEAGTETAATPPAPAALAATEDPAQPPPAG